MNEIFWIRDNSSPLLAIVLRPRGNDWLEDELRRMKQAGIQTIVSLLQEEEAELLGLVEEGPLAEKLGMQFVSYPIPDVNVPQDRASFERFAAELASRLRSGVCIGVHCRGSIGRASLTTSCTLIELGWEPRAALTAVETARGCPVPDTEEQREWILGYKERA